MAPVQLPVLVPSSPCSGPWVRAGGPRSDGSGGTPCARAFHSRKAYACGPRPRVPRLSLNTVAMAGLWADPRTSLVHAPSKYRPWRVTRRRATDTFFEDGMKEDNRLLVRSLLSVIHYCTGGCKRQVT